MGADDAAAGPRPAVAVIGPGDCVDPSILSAAERAGAIVAEAGWTLLTGGLGGVMEAASRGASSAGGQVVSILPGDDPADGNAYATIRVATGAGQGRNVALINSAGGVLAIGRGHGTLSEIALALRAGKPIVGVSSWRLDGECTAADSVDDALLELRKLMCV